MNIVVLIIVVCIVFVFSPGNSRATGVHQGADTSASSLELNEEEEVQIFSGVPVYAKVSLHDFSL